MQTADTTVSTRTSWMRDPDAYDPSTRMVIVNRGGETFKVTNCLGPGWPMTIHSTDRTFWSRTVDWEDWDTIDREIDARQAR